MRIGRLIEKLKQHGSAECVIEDGKVYSYRDLLREISDWKERINGQGITPGQVVAVQSDYRFTTIALLLALLENANIVVLLSPQINELEPFLTDSQVDFLFSVNSEGVTSKSVFKQTAKHELLDRLNRDGRAGFVIFSSGTSGRPKAILHDLDKFLTSFENVNRSFRTLAFLLLDHIAGVDTLLYTLSSGGSLVLTSSRSPNRVCQLVSDHQVEVLPVSPSFLNLMFLTGEYKESDLSSVKIITFGSEPASQSLVERLSVEFPRAKIIQKYGTSEFGSPRSKTKEGDSSWIKLDSDEFETKVVDNVLWIKSSSTMLGYLNAKGMHEQDGWLCTGDLVEVKDGWYKILGRQSDLINVGGEKVYPIEVESAINDIDGVDDVMVYGIPNPLLGNQVCALIQIGNLSEKADMKKRIRKHCLQVLERYKVPSKYEFTCDDLTNVRHKKVRSAAQEGA